MLWTVGSLGTALLVFSLVFSIRAYIWGFGRNGLNMTILAVGACMVIAAAAQTQWRAPRIFEPILKLGQRSYEVYLTHVFVVLISSSPSISILTAECPIHARGLHEWDNPYVAGLIVALVQPLTGSWNLKEWLLWFEWYPIWARDTQFCPLTRACVVWQTGVSPCTCRR